MLKLYNKLKTDNNLINRLFIIAQKKEYPIFTYSNTYKHNINIWGIRSNDKDTSRYNDVFIWFYQESHKGWDYRLIRGTTDPSEENLLKPVTPKGTMILPEGHYKAMWKLGLHKGEYEALVQNIPLKVWRDNNKDKYLDFTGFLESGWQGCNFHRASKWKVVDNIGLYSAGCQVVRDVNTDWNIYIRSMFEIFKQENQKTFSYTLINENDYDLVKL